MERISSRNVLVSMFVGSLVLLVIFLYPELIPHSTLKHLGVVHPAYKPAPAPAPVSVSSTPHADRLWIGITSYDHTIHGKWRTLYNAQRYLAYPIPTTVEIWVGKNHQKKVFETILNETCPPHLKPRISILATRVEPLGNYARERLGRVMAQPDAPSHIMLLEHDIFVRYEAWRSWRNNYQAVQDVCTLIPFRLDIAKTARWYFADERRSHANLTYHNTTVQANEVFQCGERYFYTPNSPFHAASFMDSSQVKEFMSSPCWETNYSRNPHHIDWAWDANQTAISANLRCMAKRTPACVPMVKVASGKDNSTRWQADPTAGIIDLWSKFRDAYEQSNPRNPLAFGELRIDAIWPNQVLLKNGCATSSGCCKIDLELLPDSQRLIQYKWASEDQ